MTMTFPNESPEYRATRDALLQQEIELRRLTEKVAAARRALPPGGAVPENYVFDAIDTDGKPTTVTLLDLFAPGKDTLFVYNMMFPRPDANLPCPSCTQFLDAFDGVARHATQRINVVIVVKTEVSRALAHAKARGWKHMRFISSAHNTFNRDYHGESEDGTEQQPMSNVFRREGQTVRHFWGSELLYAPSDENQDPRHGDSIDPLWNLFDLIPDGRGTDWYPDLAYT